MALPLRALGDETWGERLGRARGRSGLKLREAAEIASRVWPTTHTSLLRLESLREPPTDQRRRFAALLAVLVYGFNPEDFGLSLSDIPALIDRDRLADLLIRIKRWIGQSAA